MSYCPKCGNKVSDEMVFCPKCGAPIKAEQASVGPRITPYRRHEKEEKTEKHEEKTEKGEKHEKHEYGFVGPLIGGLILIFIGSVFYLQVYSGIDRRMLWALFLVMIGLVIIIGVAYGAIVGTRRHPRP